MKLRNNKDGALGTKALIVLGLIGIILGAYMTGVIDFNLPSATTDEYEETVIRGVTDVGMKIPLNVRLTFVYDASTGDNKADLDINLKHRHNSGSNKAPDAEVVGVADFNAEVGNVGDTTTIYAVDGNTFTASDVAYNSTVKSVDYIDYGFAQNNYKVWTKSSVYTPPASNPTKNNHVIVIQVLVEHFRKVTNQLLGSDTITFGVYYTMPDYNEDDSYTKSYTYWLYIPFDDYAVVEDIKLEVLSYHDSCLVQWKTVTTVVKSYWEVKLFGISIWKVCKQRDTTVSTNLIYDWQNPKAYSINNANDYGSHRYTYKVR